MAFRFDADETVSAAFRRTAHEQLLAAETALRHDAESDPVAAVHEARKSVKKERALLRLMRGSVRRSDRRAENAALRDAAQRLSGARDAEVMVQTLDDLAERYAGQVAQHEFASLRGRLADEIQEPSGVPPEASLAASELAAARERIAGWRLRGYGWAAVAGGVMVMVLGGVYMAVTWVKDERVKRRMARP